MLYTISPRIALTLGIGRPPIRLRRPRRRIRSPVVDLDRVAGPDVLDHLGAGEVIRERPAGAREGHGAVFHYLRGDGANGYRTASLGFRGAFGRKRSGPVTAGGPPCGSASTDRRRRCGRRARRALQGRRHPSGAGDRERGDGDGVRELAETMAGLARSEKKPQAGTAERPAPAAQAHRAVVLLSRAHRGPVRPSAAGESGRIVRPRRTERRSDDGTLQAVVRGN
jgi:hypothetical protein